MCVSQCKSVCVCVGVCVCVCVCVYVCGGFLCGVGECEDWSKDGFR